MIPAAPRAGSIKADALLAAVAAKRSFPRRKGRPADPESARSRQPWRAAGVSQRTWYRRQALAQQPAPPPEPVQQAAHVAAWYATLGALAQLEHRAFVRRCLRGLT